MLIAAVLLLAAGWAASTLNKRGQIPPSMWSP